MASKRVAPTVTVAYSDNGTIRSSILQVFNDCLLFSYFFRGLTDPDVFAYCFFAGGFFIGNQRLSTTGDR
jgi:hypothetical protein